MHRNRPLLVFLTLLSLSGLAVGQLWSGVLDPTRAIDWSNAGVVGGIPSATWTQCGSTIAAGASAATIQAAINACGRNQYVLLGAGTFTLSTGLMMKSNMALRGMGADQTTVSFSNGSGSCTYSGADICFQNGYVWFNSGSGARKPGGSNAANWTAGFARGTTQITLTNVGSSGLSVGQYILLDQANDTSDTGNLYVCDNSCSAQGGSDGRTIGAINHSQAQAVKIVSCSPSCPSGGGAGPYTVTISPGLYASNWSSAKTAGASWTPTIQNAGIEDLGITFSSGNSNAGGIVMAGAYNCWVKGTKQIYGSGFRNFVWIFDSGHVTVQDNYFYGGGGSSLSYGSESRIASDDLIINNIFERVTDPVMLGSATGEVVAYNFSINDYYNLVASWFNQAHYSHDAGTLFNLLEANVAAGMRADIIHGGGGLVTLFRNRYNGWEAGKTMETQPIQDQSYQRYFNYIGNVLGRSGYHTGYQNTNASDPGGNYIFDLGSGDSGDGTVVRADTVVVPTTMRWGNFDTVNNAVRWQSSEVPTSTNCGSPCSANYANAVPSTQTLPASFFLSSQPAWWPSGKAWPPIGPEVTGGNIGVCSGGTYAGSQATASGQCTGGTLASANLGGRAYSIPAMDCYLSVMGGPPDGSGGALTFHANNCYTANAGGTPPPPPTNLGAVVR
jgi:hypothetical protein